MLLSELIEGLDGREIYAANRAGLSGVQIKGLSADSRLTKDGDLFFCLTGGATDSHCYAKEAVERGAVALVVEYKLDLPVPQIVVKDSREAMSLLAAAFYGYPSKDMKIVAITGTNGKTTTSYMLASILEEAGKKTGIVGTLGIFYGKKKIAPELTTPDPIFLQETLADMRADGVEYVVMEVSAHALHYKKTLGVNFAACIFTNLSQDHLDFFENMTAYSREKEKLFTDEICPLAVVNGDDKTGRGLLKLRRNPTFVYAIDSPAEAFAVITSEGLYGSEFMLNLSDELCRVSLPMTGRHNIYNALAAATCACALGIYIGYIKDGLKKMRAVGGRLERVERFHGGDIFVDFAHTPDGLEKSLAALKAHCKGKLICLFGCGGNRDKSKRPLMGEAVAKKADFGVLSSDNPRYEDPLDIISDIEKGYRRFSKKYVVVPDREKAIDYALDLLGKGDILLVAGKGGEEYQEIMGIKYFFNDNDIIKKRMEQKRENPFL